MRAVSFREGIIFHHCGYFAGSDLYILFSEFVTPWLCPKLLKPFLALKWKDAAHLWGSFFLNNGASNPENKNPDRQKYHLSWPEGFKSLMVSAKIAMWDVFYPATERTIQIQRTTGNDWCDCHVNVYIYTHAYIYILYALYKPVTPSPHEIHIATEVKKRIDKQLRHNLSVSPEPRLRYQRKQSPFFGANSGTVRVFSTTIQVVCVFCRS